MRNLIIATLAGVSSLASEPAMANLWETYPPPGIPSTCKYPLYGPYSTAAIRDAWAKKVFPRGSWSGNQLAHPPSDPPGYPGYWCGYFGAGYYFTPGA